MLTVSQRKTYDFIKKFLRKHQYSPTTAEIAEGIGIQSRGVVHRYLKALSELELIQLLPNRHRNIRLLDTQLDKTLPLAGVIAAGRPIEAIEQKESIDVASIFLGAKRYALKVKGDSMIDEGIFDGDIVVCEQSATAEDGQIVVALIDQQEATLKRLYRSPDRRMITLEPANPRLQPVRYSADRIEIQGLYVGLLRFRI